MENPESYQREHPVSQPHHASSEHPRGSALENTDSFTIPYILKQICNNNFTAQVTGSHFEPVKFQNDVSTVDKKGTSVLYELIIPPPENSETNDDSYTLYVELIFFGAGTDDTSVHTVVKIHDEKFEDVQLVPEIGVKVIENIRGKVLG